jgi:hypothetical protein
VLLLVHQKARGRGWEGTDGTFLTFSEVVAHLRRLADENAGPSHRRSAG